MVKSNWAALVAGLSIVAVGIGCSSGGSGTGGDTTTTTGTTGAAGTTGTTGGTAQMVTASQVMDVINQNCMPCHAGASAKAKLNMESVESLLKGSENGAVVTAGDAANSKIIKAVTGAAGVKKMPPAPKPALSAENVKLIEDWINAGAKTG